MKYFVDDRVRFMSTSENELEGIVEGYMDGNTLIVSAGKETHCINENQVIELIQ